MEIEGKKRPKERVRVKNRWKRQEEEKKREIVKN